MKNEKHYLLFLLSLIAFSCQTPTAKQIAKYSKRPDLGLTCISNGDGTCYENGELRETVNMLCAPVKKMNLAQDHMENMEYFYYRCKKFGRCK